MALVVLLTVVMAGAGWFARDLLVEQPAQQGAQPQPVDAGQTPVVPAGTDEPVAAVAETLAGAVVQIEVGQGQGSGVIYDEAGLILTNAHVVGGDDQVNVRLADGTVIEGDVAGVDSESDVAVVSVSHSGELSVARLATDEPRVGQIAVALGSPFGLAQTVTAGIVSAVDRPVDGEAGVTIAMLQTDAPINPGNSGGALANRSGEVIGINTSIFSRTGDNSGIGFAIPIDTAKEVADRIVGGESLDKGYLGVTTTATDDGSPGAQIESVSRGTPAASAGLEQGDVVVALDGEDVRAPDDLAARVAGHDPGEQVEVKIERDGETMTLSLELAARP